MSVAVTDRRRELAARAQQLRADGMLQREIADRLGVSRSYAASLAGEDPLGEKAAARKKSYAGVCADCGGPTDGSNGPHDVPRRCFACEQADPSNKRWTQETVIAAIQAFAAEHGRPPLSSEWLRKAVRGPHDPPTASVCGKGQPFPKWADAIEAAGFPRPYVGHRQNRNGRGANHMARTYHVLRRTDTGDLTETTVEAYSPDNAIEQVADGEGEWIAVLDNYWVAGTVGEVTRFAVVKTPE